MTNGKRDYKKVINEFGRTCQRCHEYKTWDAYSAKTVRGKLGKQPKCKICAAQETKEWNEKNKETARDRYLKRSYGISEKEYLSMLLVQNNSCLLCKKEFSDKWGPDAPVVDHCHTYGHVRGVLCNECNRGLGYFHDNKEALMNAIKYLSGGDMTSEGGQ